MEFSLQVDKIGLMKIIVEVVFPLQVLDKVSDAFEHESASLIGSAPPGKSTQKDVWDPRKVGPESVRGRSGVGPGPTRGRFELRPGWLLDRSGVNPVSVRGQSEVGLGRTQV